MIPALVLACWVLSGCASSQISNLSPRVMKRSLDGLYTLEARWDSNVHSVRGHTMTPYVVVGTQFYPMQRSAANADYWQATVPVSAGQRFVSYRFKFDYYKGGVAQHHGDSKRSPFYQLEIVE